MADWADVADLLGELSDSDDNDEEKKLDTKENCIEKPSGNEASVSEVQMVSFSISFFHLFIDYLFEIVC